MYRKTALSLCSIRDSESDPCLSNESGLNPIDRDLVGRGILERGISDVREREELDGGSSWTIGFEEVRITRVEKGGGGGGNSARQAGSIGFTFVGILNWKGFVSSMLLLIELLRFLPARRFEFSEMDLISKKR